MSEAKKFNNVDDESMAGYYYDSADSASSFSKSSMPPPSHLQIRLINLSSVKAAINAGRDEPVRSLVQPTVRLLRFTFALVSGVSYTIELDYRYSASITNFVYAEVVSGLTLFTLIIGSVTTPSYRYIWAIEWVLAILRTACFAVFYGKYLNGQPPADYAVVDPGSMRNAGRCNLVNALLWLVSALFSLISYCFGIKPTTERRLREEKQDGRE
jgi:hypothetical protein